MCLCATYSLARFSLIISCVQTKAITLSLSHTHRERPSNKYIARIWKEETKKQTKTLEYRILLFFPCIFPPPTWSFSSKAMFPAVMSNSTSISEEASVLSSGARIHQDLGGLNNLVSSISPQKQPQLKIKKKRSLPGNPDPDAEVIALSPKTLLATNRFVCEICNKGFQRDQNLQLHRRGHNLPWKLKQRSNKEVKKKAYVCPEASCVHHNPSRALGDLTGIKKHYCRKHGEKKWKCDKCSKIYAVQSDWKAHSKTCGTREYRCDCGTLFSRKDSFITHRAFCDALAEESARMSANQIANNTTNPLPQSLIFFPSQQQNFQNQFTTLNPWDPSHENPNPSNITTAFHNIKPEAQNFHIPHNNNSNNSPSFLHHSKGIITSSPFRNLYMHSQNSSNSVTSAYLSATALLQKAATVGAAAITGPNASTTVSVGGGQQQHVTHHVTQLSMGEFGTMAQLNNSVIPDHHHYINMKGLSKNETRDFLGLANGGGGRGDSGGNAVEVSINVKDMLTFTGNVEYQNHHQPYEHHLHSSQFKSQQQGGFGFIGTTTAPESWGNC